MIDLLGEPHRLQCWPNENWLNKHNMIQFKKILQNL